MIDWQTRLDELNFFLNRTWQIDDPLAVSILAAALTGCPNTRTPWLTIETAPKARVSVQ
jgi:hypothetical protein